MRLEGRREDLPGATPEPICCGMLRPRRSRTITRKIVDSQQGRLLTIHWREKCADDSGDGVLRLHPPPLGFADTLPQGGGQDRHIVSTVLRTRPMMSGS